MLSDFLPTLPFSKRDVILPLQINPELWGVPKIPTKTQCRIRTDGATAMQDIGNPARGNTEKNSKSICTQVPRRDFALENSSGVNGWCHVLTLVIFDNFNLVGTACFENETDAPPRIHSQSPLIFAVALQLVQFRTFKVPHP